MAVLDNELLEDAALDAEIVAHVRHSLPSEVSARFDEEQLYYFHDLIEEFLADSDILDAEPDKEGFVNVDLERIAETLRRTAHKDKVGDFSIEDLELVVEAELSYGDDFE